MAMERTAWADTISQAEALAQTDPAIIEINVRGFWHAHDGGEGLWIATAPPVAGAASSLAVRLWGACWFRLAYRAPLDPRALGARGDGVSDDTAAIADAIALSGDVHFSAGRYAVKNVLVQRSARMTGSHGASIIALDPDGQPQAHALVHIEHGGCTLDGLAFEAPTGSDRKHAQGPHALLLVEKRQAGQSLAAAADSADVLFERLDGLSVRNCTFTGGICGCFCTAVDDADISNVTCTMTANWGLALMSGFRRAMLRGIRINGTLDAEGIKIGFWNAKVLAESLLLSDFIVRDCGVASVDSDLKEGIDLFMGGVRNLLVTNGIIDNCSGGGIEIKTRRTVIQPDIYQNVLVSNVLIRNRCHQKGIALLWAALPRDSGDTTHAPDSAGRVTLSDIRIWYDLSEPAETLPSKTAAITITAWSGVVCRGIDIDGGAVGFYLAAGGGSSDDTSRDLTIQSCRVRGVRNAVYVTSGVFEGTTMADCDFASVERTLSCAGGQLVGLSVRNSRFTQTGSAAATPNGYAMDLRTVTGAHFVDCDFAARKYAVFAQPMSGSRFPASSDNLFRRCHFTVDVTDGHAFLRLDDGSDWRIENCTFAEGRKAPHILAADGRYRRS
jgi:hypothetical protein